MKLYYYKKSKKHKSADTDVLILTSVGAFCEENSLSPYNGVVNRTYLNKPFLENDYLYVGVTHTDDVIIVAVSRENFGIDCENTERIMKNPDKIMCRFFTENERQYILSQKDKNSAFLDIWVKKEAYVKYTGEGISGLCSCDVTQMCGHFTAVENDKNLIIYIYKE